MILLPGYLEGLLYFWNAIDTTLIRKPESVVSLEYKESGERRKLKESERTN